MTNAATFTYLKTIHFQEVKEWDIKRYSSKVLSSSFPIIYLDQAIDEQSKKYAINNPSVEYGILGVNNQTGIFDAYTESGAKIKQKYKKMETGWIAYNPYRVNVGSVGIKEDRHTNEYISPAYVVFSCKDNLNPYYLFLTMKTTQFHQEICDATTGSVRQNLSFDNLVKLQIPLPSLPEQESLVSSYNAKMQQAALLDNEAEDIEKDIQKYLMETLGIEQEKIPEPDHESGLLKMVRFKDVERWDYSSNIGNKKISSKYAIRKFKNCLLDFMVDENGHSLRIETSKYPEGLYEYIGMENVEKWSGILIDVNTTFGKDIKSQTIKVPKHYYIFGKLRPYLNKYWYNGTDKQNIICSSEFFVFSIKKDISPYYFLYYLSSIAVQNQISNSYSGARMPRINEDTFGNIQIPIPSQDIQNEIVNTINKKKEQVKLKKLQAEELREAALVEFEKDIFS